MKGDKKIKLPWQFSLPRLPSPSSSFPPRASQLPLLASFVLRLLLLRRSSQCLLVLECMSEIRHPSIETDLYSDRKNTMHINTAQNLVLSQTALTKISIENVKLPVHIVANFKKIITVHSKAVKQLMNRSVEANLKDLIQTQNTNVFQPKQ